MRFFLAECGLNCTFSRRFGLEAQAGTPSLLPRSEDVSLAKNASTIRQGVVGGQKKANTAAIASRRQGLFSNQPTKSESDLSLASSGRLLLRASRRVLARIFVRLKIRIFAFPRGNPYSSIQREESMCVARR